MTERELRAVRDAMFGSGGSWGDDDLVSANGYAERAIQASDSQYVKGLVEALKECMVCLPQDHNDEVVAWNKAKTALNNLPEDLR